jgi:hypothetical protein
VTPEPRVPRWPRIVAALLFWMGARSIYTVVIGDRSPGYGAASGSLFGLAATWGAGLHCLLAIGAAVGIWVRWRHTVQLLLAALAVGASLLVFELQQVEAQPERARALYAEHRRLRGLPIDEARLDQMFSPAGRRAVWGIGAVMMLGPLAVVLWRRRDFEPPDPDD